MRVFRIRCELDRFHDIDLPMDESSSALREQFKSDDRLLRKWKSMPAFDWETSTKNAAYPHVAYINWRGGFCVSDKARILFESLSPKCCEVLPAQNTAAGQMSLVHVFSADVFPRDHYHSNTIIGDFATEVDTEALTGHPLFRDRTYRDDGTWVPSVYLYGTEEFKSAYDAAQLTGLLLEPFWPFRERMQYLWQRIRDDAAAEERGKLLRGNTGDGSPMPTGRPRKPKVTWKKKQHPTPEQLAAYLWQSVIDERMSGDWLGDAVGANTPDALGITKLTAEAVTRLLNMGVDRNVLCHLARAICFEAITRTFATLEETGISWLGDEPDWESLQMAMTQEATLGKDGALGGWPPK